MTSVTTICSMLLGNILWHMGYGPRTWQFWAVLILYVLPNSLWFYKNCDNSKEKDNG